MEMTLEEALRTAVWTLEIVWVRDPESDWAGYYRPATQDDVDEDELVTEAYGLKVGDEIWVALEPRRTTMWRAHTYIEWGGQRWYVHGQGQTSIEAVADAVTTFLARRLADSVYEDTTR
jgi:hypothetical protein